MFVLQLPAEPQLIVDRLSTAGDPAQIPMGAGHGQLLAGPMPFAAENPHRHAPLLDRLEVLRPDTEQAAIAPVQQVDLGTADEAGYH